MSVRPVRLRGTEEGNTLTEDEQQVKLAPHRRGGARGLGIGLQRADTARHHRAPTTSARSCARRRSRTRARKRDKGEITADQLKAIEDAEIKKIVAKQEECGLKLATDGEFRRSWWHFDFLCGLDGVMLKQIDSGIQFAGVQTRPSARTSSAASAFRVRTR